MTKKTALVWTLFTASLCFCLPLHAEEATDTNSVKTQGKGLTEKEVRNAIYRISPWESGNPDTFVKFKDGTWKDGEESMAVTAVALGDLNKDGTTDAAAVYYTSGGGTGVFFNVTAFVNKNGRLMAVDNKVLGDRVGLRRLRIKDGVIIADVVSHGPGDGASQTSVNRTGKYRLKGEKLIGPDTMY
ncbi:MAG: hypothetical protein JST01_16045 [Cyanobacteria bacterium SZAS TMP-1]|nr:hypothetical protein [Cyanobacteria bacterium SZAS TMP-1]